MLGGEPAGSLQHRTSPCWRRAHTRKFAQPLGEITDATHSAFMPSCASALWLAPAATRALTQSTCPAQAARCSAVRRCMPEGRAATLGLWQCERLAAVWLSNVRGRHWRLQTLAPCCSQGRSTPACNSQSLHPHVHRAAPGWPLPRSGQSGRPDRRCERRCAARTTWPQWRRTVGGAVPAAGCWLTVASCACSVVL